jgi:hypothetical protein
VGYQYGDGFVESEDCGLSGEGGSGGLQNCEGEVVSVVEERFEFFATREWWMRL